MISIQQIRDSDNKILVLSNHEPIIQSILDFDYLSNKTKPSVAGIMTGKRGVAKYFFGRNEIMIPTLTSPVSNVFTLKSSLWFLNLNSGRRALASSTSALQVGCLGGAIFAENVPELHSLQIISTIHNLPSTKLVVGPASVGLLVPGALKLGPIGGITPKQIIEGQITESGSVAVLSASGGMTNELINIASQAGHKLSFALSFGGDRFPVLSPRDAFLLAESDPATKTVLYYGELGGEDEYELVKLKQEDQFTKNVIAHIAGTVASLFPESPQFGHAKAKADKERTTATAKRATLKSVGFQVSNSFTEFIILVNKLK